MTLLKTSKTRRAPRTSKAKPKPDPATPPDIVSAINNPQLFQPWFPGPTWDGWRAVLRAAYALPMTATEVEFFKSIAGGREPPTRRVKEIFAATARRSGKDSMASGIAAWAAAFFNQHHRLRPGERAVVMCLACDRDQAKIVLNYIRSYFEQIPMLKSMVQRETASGFELNNGIDITVATNNYRSVRGRPILLAILDEVSFFATRIARHLMLRLITRSSPLSPVFLAA